MSDEYAITFRERLKREKGKGSELSFCFCSPNNQDHTTNSYMNLSYGSVQQGNEKKTHKRPDSHLATDINKASDSLL